MKQLFICLWFFISNIALATTSVDTLFKQTSRSIFQVKMIDVYSGSQSAIGTGFIVDDGYLFATNYHVISSLIEKPDRFRAEIHQDGQKVSLDLTAFDVVNDLALLKPKNNVYLGKPIPLALNKPNQGHTLYSIGNPQDIGMTVVNGTYNGLVEYRFIDSIHFSGSINPGMSGGPTINADGHVIGINVATSGNDIGFLVPVDKLIRLIKNIHTFESKNYYSLLQQQITDFSTGMVDDMLAESWTLDELGDSQIPDILSTKLNCWGSSKEKNKDKGINVISKNCRNRDRIYVTPTFNVGVFEYSFQYYEAEDWNSVAFYRLIQKKIADGWPGNEGDKENVHSYDCKTNIVKNVEPVLHKKITYCVRSYKKIKHLYDAFYLATHIDKKSKTLVEHYTLSGVTRHAAERFLDRFIGAAIWQ